uniref:Transmembrane protein n=1 Tax=Medicago truncatula TaxID=3880 RepID=A2Q4F4_MEDTR|nr:hypothetical protein MtrDRAFT_AC157473g21v2 [Medicago truncatula]
MRGGGDLVVMVVVAALRGSCGVVMVWFGWMVIDNIGLEFCDGTLCGQVLYKGWFVLFM